MFVAALGRNNRRKFLGVVCAILTVNAAAAADYPIKPIRIIAPFPPASVADVLARPIAQKMAETWGQPVIVDNRAGAAGNVGAELVAKAPPDGYTLLLGTIGTNAVNAALYAKLP
jgi:tripartite-type tricarboxylate transporter receptor subunit TctC